MIIDLSAVALESMKYFEHERRRLAMVQRVHPEPVRPPKAPLGPIESRQTIEQEATNLADMKMKLRASTQYILIENSGSDSCFTCTHWKDPFGGYGKCALASELSSSKETSLPWTYKSDGCFGVFGSLYRRSTER